MTTYLSGNRKNKLVLDRYPAVGRIVNRSAQIKRKELQMKVVIDGTEYEPKKPLLADAQVGWLCQRRDGEWVQIAVKSYHLYIMSDELSCYTNGRRKWGTESYLDIVHTEPLAPEGTAEWAIQQMNSGYNVIHPNDAGKTVWDLSTYNANKHDWDVILPTYGWRIYEPEPAKESCTGCVQRPSNGALCDYCYREDKPILYEKKPKPAKETELFAGIKKGDIVSITAPCGSVVRKATVVSDKSFWVDDPCDYEFSKLTGRTSHIGLYAIKPDPASAKSPAYEVGDYYCAVNDNSYWQIRPSTANNLIETVSLSNGQIEWWGEVSFPDLFTKAPASQVVLSFGAFSGTVEPLICECCKGKVFLVRLSDRGFIEIPFSAIKDPALQSTVKALLAAIEKEK